MDGAFAPPVVVDPSDIESSLNQIWEKLASHEGGAKMRACLFNLILVTQNTPRVPYFRGVAERVIEKFPSRVLFINIEKGKKEEDLRTSVSVVGASGHMSDVACDFIEFSIPEGCAERIPFAVLPHLITDLPVYLLWAEDPILENPLSYQLEKLASRMIFDSESTENLTLFAKSLLHHHEVVKCDIADLNWARTETWRTLILSTFRSPARLKELADTASLKIEYNALETTFFCHTKIQAVYLQGWLACQLGWQFQESQVQQNKDVFIYKNAQNQPISIELIPGLVKDLTPGVVISFRLSTRGEEHFEFVLNPDTPLQITLYICSRDKCEMPTQFVHSKGGIGFTLVKEICRKGTSAHFLCLMEFLSKLDPKTLCK